MATETNWAGSYTYRAQDLVHPGTVEELQALVAGHRRVRALGSRHTFTELPDTDGLLVGTARLPEEVTIDAAARSATVSAGTTYGVVAERLQAEGWALANLASLPHISVAGAVATGTHGSGDRNGSLSAAVRALELVGADGELRRVERGEPDFAGSVVALGCLGIVTRVTLDAEPAFELRQDVFTDIPWQDLQTDFDNLTGNAYSVSVFTDWLGDRVRQVWVKSRADQPPAERLLGRPPAGETLHMLRGGALEAVTEQGGVPGPWHERLPHFRTAFTPSRGEELQSEYLLPRACLADAVDGLRTLGDRLTGVLQGSEIRTVAADELWLSGAYGADVAGVHFTWVRDPAGVYAVLPLVEEVLLPMGGRPHWGKCFVAAGGTVTGLYPRMADFAGLRDRMDPGRKFLNDYVSRVLGLSG